MRETKQFNIIDIANIVSNIKNPRDLSPLGIVTDSYAYPLQIVGGTDEDALVIRALLELFKKVQRGTEEDKHTCSKFIASMLKTVKSRLTVLVVTEDHQDGDKPFQIGAKSFLKDLLKYE